MIDPIYLALILCLAATAVLRTLRESFEVSVGCMCTFQGRAIHVWSRISIGKVGVSRLLFFRVSKRSIDLKSIGQLIGMVRVPPSNSREELEPTTHGKYLLRNREYLE